MVVEEEEGQQAEEVVQEVVGVEEEDDEEEKEIEEVGLERVLHVLEGRNLVDYPLQVENYSFETILLDPEFFPGKFGGWLFPLEPIIGTHGTVGPSISPLLEVNLQGIIAQFAPQNEVTHLVTFPLGLIVEQLIVDVLHGEHKLHTVLPKVRNDTSFSPFHHFTLSRDKSTSNFP